MQVEVVLLKHMALTALPRLADHAIRAMAADPPVARASLGIPDTLFIFVVALVVFGPKRLPEIGKQLGKLMFEFRRASNDFKLQIEEELRLAEQQDRQKQIDMQAAAAAKTPTPAVQAAQLAATSGSSDEDLNSPEPPPPPDRTGGSLVPPSQEIRAEGTPLIIQPPSTGTPVAALPPNHAATLMTPIPPASAPPAAATLDAAEPDAAAIETTPGTAAHHG